MKSKVEWELNGIQCREQKSKCDITAEVLRRTQNHAFSQCFMRYFTVEVPDVSMETKIRILKD